jgi:dTDP-4-dehydrorhamnose 3,5-epimerase
LPGILLLEPNVFGDARGFFMETWHRERYREAGLPADFVQDNVSLSGRGVLRGLHFQHPHAQGKLVYVLEGEVLDVAVDVRLGSSTFGKWLAVLLSAENRRQMYIPEGFAHGLCTLSERALFVYKCTELYHPEAERTILWNDPDIAIAWPLTRPLVSPRDAHAPRLKDLDVGCLPRYRGVA